MFKHSEKIIRPMIFSILATGFLTLTISPVCLAQSASGDLQAIATNTGNTASNTSNLGNNLSSVQKILVTIRDSITKVPTSSTPNNTILGSIYTILNSLNAEATKIYNALTGENLANLSPYTTNQEISYTALSNSDKAGTSSISDIGIEQQALSNLKDASESLTNLKAYGQFQATGTTQLDGQDPAPDGNYSVIAGESSYASNAIPASASDLLQPDIYSDADLTKLQDFLKNVSGSGYALYAPAISKDQLPDTGYVTFQRTLDAMQSVANYNIAKVYADRKAIALQSNQTFTDAQGHSMDSDGHYVKDGYIVDSHGQYILDAQRKKIRASTSVTSLLHYMNTHNPGSQNFWNKFMGGGLTLFDRLHMIIVSFFGINYNLYHISQQLEQTNLQLAILISQNNYVIQDKQAAKLTAQEQQNEIS